MKSIYFTFFIIYFIFLSYASAQDKYTNVQFINNKSPKYADSVFITLEELHSIDINEFDKYYISKVRAMDVDIDTNLYVLDFYEGSVTVFDKFGKYLRSMGSKGQGPNELERPISICIYDERIYIYEKFKGMKIWDLNGKYIDFIFQHKGNFDTYKTFQNSFIGTQFNLSIGGNINIRNYSVDRYTHNFELINTIVSIEIDVRKYIRFLPDDFVAINSKQQIYFPEKADEYIINKFDLDGNLLQSFGREYNRITYSNRIKNFVSERQFNFPPNIRRSLSKYPPIVRYIVIDDKDYVWVAVGEWYFDDFGSISIPSTIDIFDENGKFLYTFKSPYLGSKSFIKNGRLYSMPTEDDLTICVFKIHYNY